MANLTELQKKLNKAKAIKDLQRKKGDATIRQVFEAALSLLKENGGKPEQLEALVEQLKRFNENMEDRKEIEVSNFPDEFSIDNFPKSFDVDNFPEGFKILNPLEIKNFPDFPTGFNVKNLPKKWSIESDQLRSTNIELRNINKSINDLTKKEISGSVFIRNSATTEAIPVRLVTPDGKSFYTAISQMLGAATGTSGSQLALLIQILAELSSINSKTGNIELDVDTINLNTDTLEALIASSNTKLDTVIGHVDGVETLIGSTNTKLDTLIAQTDTVETLLTAVIAAINSIGGGASGIVASRKVVVVTNTAIALGSAACKTVFITALTTNTDVVVIGDSGVVYTEASRTGKVMYPGDSMTISIDNISKLFVNGLSGQGVSFSYTT